ncbi:MAG: hypothetical protein B6D55_07655 [Candidatus Omnitrophica bacterium 4484_70.2]|nr:MAG: hypothetical protein B6D55_07655 [Candidatus Omnitrophica bacterium 4484_70.2]
MKLEIVLPVYNEEEILEKNVIRVKNFLKKHNFRFTISIVDNGSTDNTYKIAKNLADKNNNVFAFKLKKKGRGRALKFRVTSSSCAILGYMDIDLSADLYDFLMLYKEIQNGYDIVIGSRLLPASSVRRSILRELLSRVYNKMVRRILSLPFFDYQCGFKLFRRENIAPLIPLIKNNNWFFDTELIFYAYRKNLKIREIPIRWKERKYGKVKLFPTIIGDIKGIMRLKFNSAV